MLNAVHEIDEVITVTTVPERQRMTFLPKYFGKGMMVFEGACFSFIRNMTEDYTGGMWKFCTLSNGGAYMAPDTDRKFKMASENGYEGEMSADAAGIAVTLFALSHLAFQFEQYADLFSERYYQLRDYAYDHHPEASAIIALCD